MKIHRLFDALLDRGGSDLHVAVGYPPLARVRGDLVAVREQAMTRGEVEETLFELLDPAQKAKIDGEGDLDFAHAYGQRVRFRANYFHKHTGLAAVFRVIPSKVPTLSELRCPDVVRRLADRRAGRVLVTGPTGSGKSTSLAAVINQINESYAKHILTIEDPIEFVHPNKKCVFSQREVGVHASGFGPALRAALREDADVILVGEMRDYETISLALTAAEMGALVFGIRRCEMK